MICVADVLNVALGKEIATEPYVSTVVLAGHILKQSVSDEQATELLGEIAQGTLRVALAHQENGGHPLSLDAANTVARAGRGGFVLRGAKILSADAPSASKLIVSARIEGEDGLGLFLVGTDQAGAEIESYPLVDGCRAADVALIDVSLPIEALLVDCNHGAAVLQEAIHRAPIALMAQAVGATEASLKICGDYAKERKQFRVTIGSFQAIQHMLSDMFFAAYQARSMLYHAIANADAPETNHAAALSAARIVVGEVGQLVSRSGMQIHGGYGLTDEYAISHYFRRLMCLEKQYGDLGLHTERFGDSIFA